ncbi:RING finger protein 223-like, partial [Brachyistius frenatus]|uniref:RING finger protein 223-like n=1 Tax=Brachyistius frenatus TaxID=100188 RepID=UPI0037E812E8
MNPYGDTDLSSRPSDDVTAPGSLDSPPYSASENSHNASLPVVQTGHSSTLNPYPGPATPPRSFQVSVIVPSPLRSPLPSQCSEESCPDLECSICFSQFNNVFRCPKMLQCKHTFCLECLARINVKSAEPGAIQCPL